jgi:hypothetical protein
MSETESSAIPGPETVSGPPKKGQGLRPSILPLWKTPRVSIEETKSIPVIDSHILAGDQALLEAKRKREKEQKAALVRIPKSIKGVDIVISGEPTTAGEATISETLRVVKSLATAETEAEAGAEQEQEEEVPLDDSSFKQLAASVHEKIDLTPIRAQPQDKIFMPANRRGIHNFIIQTYQNYILKKPRQDPIGDACKQLAGVSSSTIENFAYQEFVRDYMQKDSPYRGILVYHGLGSGKTCTSIAAAEGIRFGGMRKIFVMTPATLSGNYRKELSLCGYYAFKRDNNWEKLIVPLLENQLDDTSSQFVFLTDTYGLSNDYLQSEFTKKKKNHFWVANPNGPTNFASLSAETKVEIENQIAAHMKARFEFIHYNGLREPTIREWICAKENIFDGAVIVIDEVHNLIRTIVGSRIDYFFKFEPREPQYKGAFCETPKKYRIAYGIYRLLCNAVGCKIIALSGTPIINKPHEIAVLANILAGDRRICNIPLNPRADIEKLEMLLKKHPEVDFYKFPDPKTTGAASPFLTISPVPSGMIKVVEADGTFKGFVRRVEEESNMRERDLDAWYQRVASVIGAGTIIGEPMFEALPQLPDIEKDFTDTFIDRDKLVIIRTRVLKARLTGLISYYKGNKKELVARVKIDEVVRLPMSDWQLGRYIALRKQEIESETKPAEASAEGSAGARMAGDLTLFERDLYTQATKSVNSAFKIFSRAACNFVFPDGIARPTPSDLKKAAALLGVRDEPGEEEAGGEGETGVGETREIAAAQVVEETHNTRAIVKPVPLDAQEKQEQAVAEEGKQLLDKEIIRVGLEYKDQLQESLNQLRARGADIFSPERLGEFSPKYVAILNKVKESKGPVLIYSQFKTLEGLGIFGIACEFQTDPGYVRMDIVRNEKREWVLAEEVSKPENAGKNRYIFYTGDDEADKREILRDIFNWEVKKLPTSLQKQSQLRILAGKNPNNFSGGIVKMFMITQSGAEGISLKNVRQVHMMEPFWNNVRLEQVQGRAIRICSHKDLPIAERDVEVYTYLSTFSADQKKNKSVDESIMVRDKGLTTDEIIFTLLLTKKKLSDAMFQIMKDAAIDCTLNALEHGSKSCYMILSGGPLFLYDPDYRVDKDEQGAQFREVDTVGADTVADIASQVPPLDQPTTEATVPPGLTGAVDETRQLVGSSAVATDSALSRINEGRENGDNEDSEDSESPDLAPLEDKDIDEE